MFAATLKRLIDDKATSAQELGDLAQVNTSTVYRWINGEGEPDARELNRILRGLPPSAQEALLLAFAAGTPWQFYRPNNTQHPDTQHLDLNNDRKIDDRDALTASIRSVRQVSESLNTLQDHLVDGQLNRSEALDVINRLQKTIHQCSVAQQILVRVAEANQRKPARRPT